MSAWNDLIHQRSAPAPPQPRGPHGFIGEKDTHPAILAVAEAPCAICGQPIGKGAAYGWEYLCDLTDGETQPPWELRLSHRLCQTVLAAVECQGR